MVSLNISEFCKRVESTINDRLYTDRGGNGGVLLEINRELRSRSEHRAVSEIGTGFGRVCRNLINKLPHEISSIEELDSSFGVVRLLLGDVNSRVCTILSPLGMESSAARIKSELGSSIDKLQEDLSEDSGLSNDLGAIGSVHRLKLEKQKAFPHYLMELTFYIILGK